MLDSENAWFSKNVLKMFGSIDTHKNKNKTICFNRYANIFIPEG